MARPIIETITRMGLIRAASLDECDLTIKVGDRVRSFDFDCRADCYMEGEVKEIYGKGLPPHFHDVLWIVVDRWVWDGREKEVPEGLMAFPPANGTRHAFGGFCNGVRKI